MPSTKVASVVPFSRPPTSADVSDAEIARGSACRDTDTLCRSPGGTKPPVELTKTTAGCLRNRPPSTVSSKPRQISRSSYHLHRWLQLLLDSNCLQYVHEPGMISRNAGLDSTRNAAEAKDAESARPVHPSARTPRYCAKFTTLPTSYRSRYSPGGAKVKTFGNSTTPFLLISVFRPYRMPQSCTTLPSTSASAGSMDAMTSY
eukprot:1612983-Rhodomonas_salina.2